MKMRCPKCSTSFLVHKDGRTELAPSQTAVAAVPPPPAAVFGGKATVLGDAAPPIVPPVAAIAPPPSAAGRSAFKGTMVGVPPIAPPRDESVTDLPAIKPPPKPAVPWGSLAPPAPDAKSSVPRPGSTGPGLPKGALGGHANEGGSQVPSGGMSGGAASAFGAAPAAPAPNKGLSKKTMIGGGMGAPLAPPPEAGFVDLPAPKAAGVVDLPAPKASPSRDAFGFSSSSAASSSGLELEIDLPAPKLSGSAAADGVVDLPAPKLEIDLPAPKAAGPGGGFGAIDLPAPKMIADLPAPRVVADLPAPRGVADLPAPRGAADLPTPKLAGGFGDLDLPMPKPPGGPDEASFGDLDLPDLPPLPDTNPARSGGGFGDIELPSPRAMADIVPPKAPTALGGHRAVAQPAHDESSFGDLNAPGDSLPPSLMGNDDESNFGDVSLDDEIPSAPSRGGYGGEGAMGGSIPPALLGDDEDDELGSDDLVGEDEDALGGGEGGGEEEGLGEAGLDGEEGSEEDMEFGMADDSDVALPPEMLRRQRGETTEEDQAAKAKRAIHLVVAVAVVIAVLGGAGAALTFTDYGLFGVYFLERFMQGAGDPQFVRGVIQRAEKDASSDTYRDVRKSLSELGVARHQAGLNRELLTRSLMHECLFLVRFGGENSPHIVSLLSRLAERHNVAEGMDLARAADAARRQAWAEVEPALAAARAQAAKDPYVDLIAGEVAIRQGKLAEAEKAFGLALKNGGGARAQWGLARIAIAKNDDKASQRAIESTLQLSPLHVEARIAQARILWEQGKEDRALTTLRQALGLEAIDDQFLWISKPAQAQGYSLLGFMHEQRGRLHLARKAYEDALSADPYIVDALLGAGRVMQRERRYADALARFESALNIAQKTSNPIVLSGRKADVEARLGQGRAQLSLDRAPEAKGVLSVLMSENPNDAEILLAVGQAEEALHNKEAAESLFKKSIELAPSKFSGYLALSQFYFKQNQADKASETLNFAATKVEESAEMRRMLGQSELARNRLDSAVHEFERAAELDPQDLDAKFGLGIALRKTGQLDRARKLFDEIAARDPQFPNLTLERGQLFEAQGDYKKAADSYKEALEKDANDTALLMRLGAAQVEGGQLDDAEQTLAKVIHEVPNSAEGEYFIGRIALARGRGPDALTHFDRALSLDATQPVFHLYAARAAFALQNLGRANEEVQIALSRDPSLGDAYWVRGEVRLRAGAVKDALKDLQRALQLKPDRYEAYAAQAHCYDQLRQLPQSVEMWHAALKADPQNGEWWYFLGKQHLDMGATGSANDALEKAMSIGETKDPPPNYLADTYRLLGDIARNGNNKKSAISLYKRFMAVAPTNSPDRDEIRKILKDWEIEVDE